MGISWALDQTPPQGSDGHQKDSDTSHADRSGDLLPFHGTVRVRRNLC